MSIPREGQSGVSKESHGWQGGSGQQWSEGGGGAYTRSMSYRRTQNSPTVPGGCPGQKRGLQIADKSLGSCPFDSGETEA